ncbi:unnamed protein product [Vicia faba]|uniref:RRM domain-containing protein n=1 Tax=Vicia faba TaxID=3906 RepID=A0AAV1AEG0_VICFA|nr:unnamed protein product [Vicia faba]
MPYPLSTSSPFHFFTISPKFTIFQLQPLNLRPATKKTVRDRVRDKKPPKTDAISPSIRPLFLPPAYIQHHHPALITPPQIESILSGNFPPGFDSSTCRSVYVGNIHPQVTEPLLQELFSSAGALEGCKLIRKEKSSYGFVDYFDRSSVAIAIVTLKRNIFGQSIKVNWAHTRGQREDTSGHFSQLSIQIAFTFLVYPSLILAYMGQAAYLSKHHSLETDYRIRFYVSVPVKLRWHVLAIAILQAVVGSQAIITGTFSIIKQCSSLGCFLKVKIVHTSSKIHGQIYIPEINWSLMLLCLAVTIGF